MKKKFVYAIILGVLLVSVVLYVKLGKDTSLKVVVEEVAKKDIIETVSGSGKIYPEQKVTQSKKDKYSQ